MPRMVLVKAIPDALNKKSSAASNAAFLTKRYLEKILKVMLGTSFFMESGKYEWIGLMKFEAEDRSITNLDGGRIKP